MQVALREQVADAGEGQVPSVAGSAQELLEHRQVGHVVGPVGAARLQPAVEGGHVLRARLGEHLVDLDVRVDPRRDLAEELHQRVLAEADRRVGLLAAEEGRVRVAVEVVPREPVEDQPVDRVAGDECPQPEGHGPAVVDGVVGESDTEVGVLPLTDQRVSEPLLLLGVERHRHLVELGLRVGVHRVGVPHLHQVDHHPQTFGARELAQPPAAGDGPVASLAAEPAGAGDEVPQGVEPRVVEVAHGAVTSSVVSGAAMSRSQ
jgi:hypothetical protein